MGNFTRVLVAVMIFTLVGVTYMASSRGWWWYSFRSPVVMKESKEHKKKFRPEFQEWEQGRKGEINF